MDLESCVGGTLISLRGCNFARELRLETHGNAVVGGRVADGTSVPSDGSSENIVGSLGTDKGTSSTQDGIGGESRSLIRGAT